MKEIALLGALLALSACNSWRPATVTPELAAGTKAAVMSQMKDPSSAQFGDRFAASQAENGRIAICGTVNGKNGFGAYSGISTFAVRYSPETGKYDLLGLGDQEVFCNIAGAKGFSTTPPSSILATQGAK